MVNSKCYIFITNGIIDLGGIELYLVNKINWLIENGWDTHIFSAAYPKSCFKIESLEKYSDEIFPILSFAPYECPYSLYLKTFAKMIDLLGNYSNYSEIIIESHSGSTALWGEQIARKVNAIHIMEPLHEVYSEKCYSEKRDFFIYKLNRREIYGGRLTFATDILRDDPAKLMPLKLQYSPVMDVDDERLNAIKKVDYTISYLGRTAKPYYESILIGAYQFAKKYTDKSIQFVVIGGKNEHNRILKPEMKKLKNFNIVLLGEMFPIPKKLFSMVDVICAGAGSAMASVYENVPTIVPDPDNYMANGVLGYDTVSPLTKEAHIIQTSFLEAFENVLLRNAYMNKPFLLQKPPTVAECCEETYQLIKSNENEVVYYPSEDILHGHVSFKRRLGFIKNFLRNRKRI